MHGNNSGAIAQGNENSQTVVQTNNPGFDEAIRSLFDLIQASNLDQDNKEELVGEVVALNKLANKELTPENYEKAKLRISVLELLLKGADLTSKAAQYLPAVYAYFSG